MWGDELSHTILTVYPKKYAHGFVVLCFVVVMQSFIINSHEEFIHIHQGCFAGTGEIVRLPQCQWSKPDGYGKISQCITTTKHSKAKTVCIFLGIYCIPHPYKMASLASSLGAAAWDYLVQYFVAINGKTNTVECRYNATHYDMILHTSLQFPRHHINQCVNPHKTSHRSLQRVSHGVSFLMIVREIDRVMTALTIY